MTDKRFPIQDVGTVAWAAAEHAFSNYAQRYGTDQSLMRIAQRGGFGLGEFADLFFGYDGRSPVSRQHLIAMVSQHVTVDLAIDARMVERAFMNPGAPPEGMFGKPGVSQPSQEPK